MMKWNRTMTALSLAGDLLVMAPGLASATEIHADGPGGLLMVAGHPGGGHGGHFGRGGWHRGGGDDDVILSFGDAGYAPYAGACGFYRHRWHETGQRYWLRRYDLCLRG